MKTIKCGLLPGESRPVVERINEPLRAYLERCLDLPVELVVGSNYVATGEALRRGELDLAYLWTFRNGLSIDLRESIRHAFVGLREPAALRAYRAQAFIPAVDADVDRVRNWMEHLLQARLDPASLGRFAEPTTASANPPATARPGLSCRLHSS